MTLDQALVTLATMDDAADGERYWQAWSVVERELKRLAQRKPELLAVPEAFQDEDIDNLVLEVVDRWARRQAGTRRGRLQLALAEAQRTPSDEARALVREEVERWGRWGMPLEGSVEEGVPGCEPGELMAAWQRAREASSPTPARRKLLMVSLKNAALQQLRTWARAGERVEATLDDEGRPRYRALASDPEHVVVDPGAMSEDDALDQLDRHRHAGPRAPEAPDHEEQDQQVWAWLREVLVPELIRLSPKKAARLAQLHGLLTWASSPPDERDWYLQDVVARAGGRVDSVKRTWRRARGDLEAALEDCWLQLDRRAVVLHWMIDLAGADPPDLVASRVLISLDANGAERIRAQGMWSDDTWDASLQAARIRVAQHLIVTQARLRSAASPSCPQGAPPASIGMDEPSSEESRT